MWVVLWGDFFEGFMGIVGPFDTEDEAEEYEETHNLDHSTSDVFKVEKPG